MRLAIAMMFIGVPMICGSAAAQWLAAALALPHVVHVLVTVGLILGGFCLGLGLSLRLGLLD